MPLLFGRSLKNLAEYFGCILLADQLTQACVGDVCVSHPERVALARKEYDQATAYALDAWPLMSGLQNWRKLSQFTEIYQALLQSSYASSPQVARLGLLLFEVGAL